jgi:hypothetical protein
MAFALGGKRDLMAKLAATAHRPGGATAAPLPRPRSGDDGRDLTSSALVDVAALHPLLAEAAAALHAAAAAADMELCTVPGRGRGLVTRRPFAVGECVLTERPFAWLRWRDAHGDDRRYPSLTVSALGWSDQRALAAFLLLAPNAASSVAAAAAAAAAAPAAKAGGGTPDAACATVWDGAPSRPRRGDVIVPAIHRNGFQVELPPPPSLPPPSTNAGDSHSAGPDVAAAPPVAPPPPPPPAQQHLELLLLLSAMLNHSCEPNVAYAVRWAPVAVAVAADAYDGVDAVAVGDPPPSPSSPQLVPEIVFTALRPLAAGEELCHAYTDAGAGVADRRARLAAGYGFTCKCAKCAREEREEVEGCEGPPARLPASEPAPPAQCARAE